MFGTGRADRHTFFAHEPPSLHLFGRANFRAAGQRRVFGVGIRGCSVGGVCMLAVVAWGLVWMRLYRRNAHPELAVLTILPFVAYYVVHQTGSPVFSNYPVWANVYALSWVGFAAVAVYSVLPEKKGGNAPQAHSWRHDPVFLLLLPLIILFSISSFVNYYTALT